MVAVETESRVISNFDEVG